MILQKTNKNFLFFLFLFLNLSTIEANAADLLSAATLPSDSTETERGGEVTVREILDIPIQYALPGDTFATLDLGDYLSGITNLEVGWSYRFSHDLYNEESPDWSGSFNGYAQNMTIITQVEARDTFPEASSHKLAAFHNEELRGVASPYLYGGKWVYFLTVYSNQSLDTISFKYYHEEQASVFPMQDTIIFISDQILGNVDNPMKMEAGYVGIEKTNRSILHPTIIDKEWLGRDTIYVMARELNPISKPFRDTAMVVFQKGTDEELPVELISFTGEKVERTALLKWEIAEPENVLGYEIHRGINSPLTGNLNWEMIGFVPHSDEDFFYSFLDENPDLSKNYYRLKNVDLDGSFEWSPMINLDFESERNYVVKFFPNPTFNDQVFLDVTTEVPALVDIKIYNAVGQAMLYIRMDSNGQRQRLPVDISDFPPGIYVAKFKIGARGLSETFVVASP